MAEGALRGVSAAPGVAFGKAVALDRPRPRPARGIARAARGREADRAKAALEAAARELQEIVLRLREGDRNDEADIVETGLLMAADPSLISRVESLVFESGLPADAALSRAADQIANELSNLADPTLALRADDVRSLGRRAAARANGFEPGVIGGILVAGTLGPADVAELAMNARGVALAGGGVTAHAAIVARSLGVPMVVGLGPDALDIQDGEEVVLDGSGGVLYRNPGAGRVAAARAEAERRRLAREHAVASRLQPAETRDGHRVRVLANAASVAEVVESLEQGAEGIGLLRTELLFLDARSWPPPVQQSTLLKLILAPLTGRTVTVRLFDFGGDKTPPFLSGTTGRGIELLLDAPEALNAHLSAIVEAGADVQLRILVPMVTRPEQLRAVRQVVAAVLDGRPSPQVGAMIETPEAAQRAVDIAKESDFLSIGTNDLTQLLLGLDREQSKSAPVTDVRVLRLIDSSVRAAHAAGILVDVCGEAASDAVAMPVLVGLGVDELSVAAARVGEVRESIRGLDFADCRLKSELRLVGQAADAAGKGR